ncbi:MAG: ComF family protein [Gammaproteobacteria bacterium]|nr:ComF family protein [Gammaproteobacteria bacterium]
MSLPRLAAGIEHLLDLLLAPGLCLYCGCELAAPASLCRPCAATLPRVPQPCRSCGQPLSTGQDTCPACLLDPPRWQGLRAPLAYRPPVREWLRQLKFDGAQHFARTLCEEVTPLLRGEQPLPQVLLPVPLHPSRLRERGFNQALLIAQQFGGALGIPVDSDALRRTRATASQSGLSAAQRIDNLRGAFSWQPQQPYRHVALVDDIVTTGATADAICRVLHRAGIESVRVWAIARTIRD